MSDTFQTSYRISLAASWRRSDNSLREPQQTAASKQQAPNTKTDSALPSIAMRCDQAFQHALELMGWGRAQSRHHPRFVRFGLLQQGAAPCIDLPPGG